MLGNIDIPALWSMVRYAVVAIGAFVVGIGWATADDWSALMGQLDVIAAGAGSLVAAVVGVISRIKLIAANVKQD